MMHYCAPQIVIVTAIMEHGQSMSYLFNTENNIVFSPYLGSCHMGFVLSPNLPYPLQKTRTFHIPARGFHGIRSFHAISRTITGKLGWFVTLQTPPFTSSQEGFKRRLMSLRILSDLMSTLENTEQTLIKRRRSGCIAQLALQEDIGAKNLKLVIMK